MTMPAVWGSRCEQGQDAEILGGRGQRRSPGGRSTIPADQWYCHGRVGEQTLGASGGAEVERGVVVDSRLATSTLLPRRRGRAQAHCLWTASHAQERLPKELALPSLRLPRSNTLKVLGPT